MVIFVYQTGDTPLNVETGFDSGPFYVSARTDWNLAKSIL